MMETDEDALLCDFAETYRIYDLYQYPCEYIAMLASGLRDSSRIKMKQKGLRVTPELFALGVCADRLNGVKSTGLNASESVLKFLSGERKHTEQEQGYQSGADFMQEWNRLSGEEE